MPKTVSSGKTKYCGFIVKDQNNYYTLDENQNYLHNYSFDGYRYFQENEQIKKNGQNRAGFYIFNGDKKGIVYLSYIRNSSRILLFKAEYPKKYKFEIVEEYYLLIDLIKVYDENNEFLGYADEKGINYWKK